MVGRQAGIFLLIYITIQGNLCRRPGCPDGTACVPFSRCKNLCRLARAGQLRLVPKAQLTVCGFEGSEASHCCDLAEITEDKSCDPNELLQEEEEPPEVIPRKRTQENCGRRPAYTTGTKCADCIDSSPGQWPWMALLSQSKRSPSAIVCGGALISTRHVITAAHCLTQDPIRAVVLGESDRSRDYDCLDSTSDCTDDSEQCLIEGTCAARSVVVGVDRTVTHPGYSKQGRSSNRFDFDIGLVVLARAVEYTDYISPICLPPPELAEDPNNLLVISGWGNTVDLQTSPVPRLAERLQYAIVKELNAEDCTRDLGVKITRRQLCATSGKDGRGACKGDSGGPLARRVDIDNDVWELAGVVSGGHSCGVPQTVYTRLADSAILEWIGQEMDGP